MERKIKWNVGCYNEIDLVYEKANQNEAAKQFLTEFEELALSEVEENSQLIKKDGKPLTREEVSAMAEDEKEYIMHIMSNIGLEKFQPPLQDNKMFIFLSPHIQKVLGCTVFAVLDKLENLDGAINVIFPKVSVELLVPIGGHKNVSKFAMLITLLYPWISVNVRTTNVVASTVEVLNESRIKSEPETESSPVKESKKGFFSRIFGKK